MKSLRTRSSPLSGLVTAMIGWNGGVVLVALLVGWSDAPWPLFAMASVTALVQVAVLWPLLYLRLRLDGRAGARGALAGAITGALAFSPWAVAVAALREAWPAWLAAACVAGASVGGFLAYFFEDDTRLASLGLPTDAGRDAHWLEPFVFGAAVFAAVCLPRSVDAATYTVVVGAVAGVVAAALSHYTPDAWKASPGRALGLCAAGAVAGALGALLLRHQCVTLAAAPGAGAITVALTLLRGRVLAAEPDRVAGSRHGA
jgi:hypothetical protein